MSDAVPLLATGGDFLNNRPPFPCPASPSAYWGYARAERAGMLAGQSGAPYGAIGEVLATSEAALHLTTGAVYRRSELHERFGGQKQGGIATPTGSPAILLFTGSAGGQHGYADGWKSGVFCYFGEGQRGEMLWVRGNSAVRDHASASKDLLLF